MVLCEKGAARLPERSSRRVSQSARSLRVTGGVNWEREASLHSPSSCLSFCLVLQPVAATIRPLKKITATEIVPFSHSFISFCTGSREGGKPLFFPPGIR